jgi:hypothetical protein
MEAKLKRSRALLLTCFLVLLVSVAGCIPGTEDDDDIDVDDDLGATIHQLA